MCIYIIRVRVYTYVLCIYDIYNICSILIYHFGTKQYHTLVIPHAGCCAYRCAARLVEALHKLLSSLATKLFKAPLDGLATTRQVIATKTRRNPSKPIKIQWLMRNEYVNMR